MHWWNRVQVQAHEGAINMGSFVLLVVSCRTRIYSSTVYSYLKIIPGMRKDAIPVMSRLVIMTYNDL
jgi:hypothetical protein